MIYSVAWGVVATSIAFWVNLLMRDQFPDVWIALLLGPIVEEIAKYLGLRQTRSILIPLTFVVCESIVQMSQNIFLLKDVWLIWLFYIPLGLIMLKHILYYAVVYLCDFKLHGLVLAIVAHSIWNWYAKDLGDIPLSLIALGVTVIPVLALYKYELHGTKET